MKIALVVIALLFLIFAIILFLPVYLVVKVSNKENEMDFVSEIKYLFFKFRIKRKTKKRETKIDDKKSNTEDKITKKIENGIETFNMIEDDVVEILHYFSEKTVSIKKINFFMDFGLSNPMHTGIITGALYGVVYNILAVLHNVLTIEECDIKINPVFEKKQFDITAECILKLKSVHIIITVFKVLKMYFKIAKNKQGV